MTSQGNQVLEKWLHETPPRTTATANIRRRSDPQKYQIYDLYVNKHWAPEQVAATYDVSVDQVYLIKHRVTEAIKEEVRRLEEEIT
jgi:hypothetical protein